MLMPPCALSRDSAPSTAHCCVVRPSSSTARDPGFMQHVCALVEPEEQPVGKFKLGGRAGCYSVYHYVFLYEWHLHVIAWKTTLTSTYLHIKSGDPSDLDASPAYFASERTHDEAISQPDRSDHRRWRWHRRRDLPPFRQRRRARRGLRPEPGGGRKGRQRHPRRRRHGRGLPVRHHRPRQRRMPQSRRPRPIWARSTYWSTTPAGTCSSHSPRPSRRSGTS